MKQVSRDGFSVDQVHTIRTIRYDTTGHFRPIALFGGGGPHVSSPLFITRWRILLQVLTYLMREQLKASKPPNPLKGWNYCLGSGELLETYVLWKYSTFSFSFEKRSFSTPGYINIGVIILDRVSSTFAEPTLRWKEKMTQWMTGRRSTFLAKSSVM